MVDQVSNNLKGIRTAREITQQDIADATGLALRTIQYIESGETKPNRSTRRSIANYLGLDPEAIFPTHGGTE